MAKRVRAAMARRTVVSKKAASMRWASSKLQARTRMRDAGLKAAQHKNRPSWPSTRTVSPASAPPLATADSNTQG